MSTRLKTRSDYHDVFNSHSGGLLGVAHWVKPLLWFTLGLMLGMLYNKKDLHSCYNMLAAAESQKHSMVASAAVSQKVVKRDLAARA